MAIKAAAFDVSGMLVYIERRTRLNTVVKSAQHIKLAENIVPGSAQTMKPPA